MRLGRIGTFQYITIKPHHVYYILSCVLYFVFSRYCGHMYKAEALVALDRIADAVSHLNIDNVTDISTVPPEPKPDQGNASLFFLRPYENSIWNFRLKFWLNRLPNLSINTKSNKVWQAWSLHVCHRMMQFKEQSLSNCVSMRQSVISNLLLLFQKNQREMVIGILRS